MDDKKRYIRRLLTYQDDDFDTIMIHISTGKIKSGKYANLIKIDKDEKMRGKTFFKDDGDIDDKTDV